jgi:hypothetical protein
VRGDNGNESFNFKEKSHSACPTTEIVTEVVASFVILPRRGGCLAGFVSAPGSSLLTHFSAHFGAFDASPKLIYSSTGTDGFVSPLKCHPNRL